METEEVMPMMRNPSGGARMPRSVAQFGSASGLGPEGRRFKSCHSDHLLTKELKE